MTWNELMFQLCLSATASCTGLFLALGFTHCVFGNERQGLPHLVVGTILASSILAVLTIAP